jgi:hypothetical protein
MARKAPSVLALRGELRSAGKHPEIVSETKTCWEGGRSVHYEAVGNHRMREVAVWRFEFLGWLDPAAAAGME